MYDIFSSMDCVKHTHTHTQDTTTKTHSHTRSPLEKHGLQVTWKI